MTMLHKRVAIVATALLVLVLLAGCGAFDRPERLTIEVTTPSSRAQVTEGDVIVSGVIDDPGATLTIADETVSLAADGAFSHVVPLAYGANRIVVRAEKEGSTTATRTINLTRALTLTILSPELMSESAADRTTISGTVSDATARVRVAGSDVPVAEDGSFALDLPLHYVETVINVSAQVADNDAVIETVTITRPEA